MRQKTINRRRFLGTAISIPVSAAINGIPGLLMNESHAQNSLENFAMRMPDESHRHERTWMAFGADEYIWGRRLLPEVRRNLATIANTIVAFEPVTILVRESEVDLARKLMDRRVDLIVSELDDLWMRDTGPVFVADAGGSSAAIDFNFNGWGGKQRHIHDKQIAGFIGHHLDMRVVSTKLVLEGGGIEVDGAGTAIISRSCVLNENRNPGIGEDEFEALLKPLLGLNKIIWIPGIAGRDITDGHTDFYARFARPGVVLAGFDPDRESYDHDVTKQHIEILESATDARGNSLKIHVLEGPLDIRSRYLSDDFAAGYIGFYVCNDAVIMQNFGDSAADSKARDTISQVFPDHEVVQINVDGIAAGGGSIHCTTQQQPSFS